MAPAKDDAGEILSTGSPATIPQAKCSVASPSTGKSTSTTASDLDNTMIDNDRDSSSSSPPTHPAFFSPEMTAATKRQGSGGGTPSSPGKENACPSVPAGLNPMAASFSPLGSPLAALMTRQSSPAWEAGAGASTPDFFDAEDELTTPVGHREEDCDCNDGDRGKVMRRALRNVDMNIPAALSSEKTNGGPFAEHDTTPKDSPKQKSNKRKSNKPGVKGQAPPLPNSYADAAKQDPVAVENKEAELYTEEEAQSPKQETRKDAPTTEHGEGESKPTEKKTFAEALKDEPAGNEAKRSEKRDSLASTAVDYPELHSDSDDEDERERREKDRQNASQVLSMRWAPLRVPFKRRLQTLAVLFHLLCMGFSLSLFFFSCAIIPLWPIIIIYLTYLLFATDGVDGRLRSRREWVRRLPIWTYFAEYFPAKLHKTHDLIPTRKYILGYHPHGIISHGAWAAFATEALGFSEKFPGITNSLLTLDSNFRLPLYREYVLSMGVQSVSKEAITNLLTRGGPNNEGMGRAVTVVVGGARESLEAQPNTTRLIIKERKGFIKLALQTGADLVPVIAFGENDLYDQLDPHRHPWLHNIQRYFLKVWKFTVPLLHGRGIFNYDVGLMPYRRPMNIVVGKPIRVFQAHAPDNAEIERLHDLYTEELQKIWDRYKDEFAPRRKEEMQFMS